MADSKNSTKKNSPSSYRAAKLVLDAALQHPGLRYELPDYGKATAFKMACNRYRNRLRQLDSERVASIPGETGTTIYDQLVIRQVNAEGKADRQGTILIFDLDQIEGKLTLPDGTVLDESQLLEPQADSEDSVEIIPPDFSAYGGIDE